MSDIQTYKAQLPDTLDDLAKFSLIGPEKVKAVRAEIRAISKVGLAQEVYEQKLAEGQDIADAVVDAKVRLGELRAKLPRDKGGRAERTADTDVGCFDSKVSTSDNIKTRNKAGNRLQTLASHPETVERCKAEAREKGELVTETMILRAIASERKKPIDVVSVAKDEIDEFKKKKEEHVVSIEDAVNDKNNKKILSEDFGSKLLSASNKMNDLWVLSNTEDICGLVSTIDSDFASCLSEALKKNKLFIDFIINELRRVVNG